MDELFEMIVEQVKAFDAEEMETFFARLHDYFKQMEQQANFDAESIAEHLAHCHIIMNQRTSN